MKTHPRAAAICALLALVFAVPGYARKNCSASLNLKDCASSIDLNSVTFTDGTLTVSGILRAINSGTGEGRILSVVANLQTKERGGQFDTLATVAAPCGTGLWLSGALPLAVPGGAAQVCGGANQANVAFTAAFAGVSLVSGQPARLELVVTYDGATSGVAGELCGATAVCGSREVSARFGFVVP